MMRGATPNRPVTRVSVRRAPFLGAPLLAVWALGCLGSPAWATEEDHPLAAFLGQNEMSITLAQAVLTAVAAIPGRAVEAQLSADDGRIVYEVEIIDLDQDLRRVYVDAEAGKVIKVRGTPSFADISSDSSRQRHQAGK
jgi:hypothetical protein